MNVFGGDVSSLVHFQSPDDKADGKEDEVDESRIEGGLLDGEEQEGGDDHGLVIIINAYRL